MFRESITDRLKSLLLLLLLSTDSHASERCQPSRSSVERTRILAYTPMISLRDARNEDVPRASKQRAGERAAGGHTVALTTFSCTPCGNHLCAHWRRESLACRQVQPPQSPTHKVPACCNREKAGNANSGEGEKKNQTRRDDTKVHIRMALVCIKTLLFPPAQRTGECQRLLPDVERQAPPSLVDRSASRGFDDDKTSHSPGHGLLRCRVNPRIISDATVGLSDGLTVPFALTAGLSALGTTDLVIYAGFAELVAGAISMGLGGYLGAKGEADGYYAALEETRECVEEDRERACRMALAAFAKYSFSQTTLDSMISNLTAQPEQLVDFLMHFHHQLAEADFTPDKAYVSGVTIALGYFLGGLVPLLPYLFFTGVRQALYSSIVVMAVALFTFGWLKTALVGECSRLTCFRKALEMLVLGGVAAGAAMGCVKAIGG